MSRQVIVIEVGKVISEEVRVRFVPDFLSSEAYLSYVDALEFVNGRSGEKIKEESLNFVWRTIDGYAYRMKFLDLK